MEAGNEALTSYKILYFSCDKIILSFIVSNCSIPKCKSHHSTYIAILENNLIPRLLPHFSGYNTVTFLLWWNCQFLFPTCFHFRIVARARYSKLWPGPLCTFRKHLQQFYPHIAQTCPKQVTLKTTFAHLWLWVHKLFTEHLCHLSCIVLTWSFTKTQPQFSFCMYMYCTDKKNWGVSTGHDGH